MLHMISTIILLAVGVVFFTFALYGICRAFERKYDKSKKH